MQENTSHPKTSDEANFFSLKIFPSFTETEFGQQQLLSGHILELYPLTQKLEPQEYCLITFMVQMQTQKLDIARNSEPKEVGVTR